MKFYQAIVLFFTLPQRIKEIERLMEQLNDNLAELNAHQMFRYQEEMHDEKDS